ncbi:type II toxin-antitoxin system HipA family toxin [Xenorhabdus bovienii]|uniref:type II toxin-antitoxin system HipA family toxin n=1 Tax=Xenorhabdus bovienii TaxID=40576 RepID=UPI001EDF3EDB|nr:type II toxin-antitoxin system HipA family toxin [Xenorhabdus bovienii]MCG3472360.1 type II toxin-antitoxin system HipA family toxin [Xenorhabdus bovienii]
MKKIKQIESLNVLSNGEKVGVLTKIQGKGIYFTYDKGWLVTGFNLSPLTMNFDEKPQLAKDPRLFDGLHGPFSDSLPDGWGMLLMDRFFNNKFGDGTSRILTGLDRLAYIGTRGMGALEYHPAEEKTELSDSIDFSELFEESIKVQQGEITNILKKLRLAGGSPGGARPKAIVALSPDGIHATTAFGTIPKDYSHWIIKFRALNEPIETGAIEFAYSEMARKAGVNIAKSALLQVKMSDGTVEQFFSTKRFDRQHNKKIHMMTVSALMYADFRMPSMNYPNLLKLTYMLTKSAAEVEKMARIMVFNALSHNYDDHTKNFAFLCNKPSFTNTNDDWKWTLSPAYDLTFSNALGEHTTGFGGNSGKATRKRIREICSEYKYLKADEYIDQTLDSLSNWECIFDSINISINTGLEIFNILTEDHKLFELN